MTQFLLQAPPQGGGTFQLVMLGGIILVFWFFMIRPQAKKAKEQKKFIAPLHQLFWHTVPTSISFLFQGAEKNM